MMTLAEQFARAQGQPIEVDGHSVQMLFKKKARAGLTMRIRWVRRVDAPVQGVSVSVKGGALLVAGSKVKDVVLWTDTAPDEVTLQCDGKSVRELSLWNCWRDERDVTHAWVGNSGMIIQERGPGAYRFRCNSRPEVTFEDLVFDVEFDEPK
jgi:hypothetical protein